MTTATTPLIALSDIRKTYNAGRPNEAEVLHGLSLQLAHGEFVALIGPSGSGKSTLLNIIGLLESATSGSYRIEGDETSGLGDAELTLRRRATLGFVFQFHHLLPAFTALENVTLPALMREGRVTSAQRERALAVLASVGLQHAIDKRPGELSGGMQQRVAIARALVLEPPLVLADEPTGNLDTQSANEVFDVGAIGSALGVLLAVALIWVFSHLALGADGLPLFAIKLQPGLALQVAGIAMLCGVLAAVAPARRAAKLDPALAIRL